MKLRLLHIFMLIPGIVFAQGQSSQEQLTITTYYPSPYGVYNVLRINPSSQTPTCSTGEIYFDQGNNLLYICRGNPPAWQRLGGGAVFTPLSDSKVFPGVSRNGTPVTVDWRQDLPEDARFVIAFVQTAELDGSRGSNGHIVLMDMAGTEIGRLGLSTIQGVTTTTDAADSHTHTISNMITRAHTFGQFAVIPLYDRQFKFKFSTTWFQNSTITVTIRRLGYLR